MLEGDLLQAARLLGAGAATREALSFPLESDAKAQHERTAAAVRAALGEDSYAAAWEEGRAMTLEQAIDSAARTSGAIDNDAAP